MLPKEQSELLVDEIRIYLRLDEPLTNDDKFLIRNLIDDAIHFLNGYTGTKLDFSCGVPRKLLKDYVRYAYNNASEYFEENFAEELNRLQWTEAAESYAQLIAGGDVNVT